MPFLDSLDIANRACQHIGCPRIDNPDEDSKPNSEISFVYDKLRRAELRRNAWRFSIRSVALRAVDTTTMILDPREWDATVTYFFGSIVKDTNGLLWQSNIAENFNNDPVKTQAWDRYFGPMTVSPWVTGTSFFAGELVYKAAGNPGGFVIFMSLTSENEDDPAVATAYDALKTYNKGEVISYGGFMWRSVIELNTGISPAEAPLDFDPDTTYSTGQTVVASDGYIYSSVGNGNQGNDPTSDGGVNWTNTTVPKAWTKVPTLYTSSTKWLPIFSGMTNLLFTFPIGAGPISQTTTRNVYRLPAGYIRRANQSPKQGSYSPLGAPAYAGYLDWEFEGDYVITGDIGPIVFKFVADVTEVTKMDDMFCEGLGARIGFETCEAISQSSSKKSDIAAAYQKFMTEARMVNAIETGPEEPPEDDWITCRR